MPSDVLYIVLVGKHGSHPSNCTNTTGNLFGYLQAREPVRSKAQVVLPSKNIPFLGVDMSWTWLGKAVWGEDYPPTITEADDRRVLEGQFPLEEPLP